MEELRDAASLQEVRVEMQSLATKRVVAMEAKHAHTSKDGLLHHTSTNTLLRT